MGFLKAALISSALVVLLAFYARPQYPDTATNRTLSTVVGLYFKLIDAVSHAGSLLGLSPINITRSMLLHTVQLLDKKSESVEETSITIDGVEAIMFRPKELSGISNPGLVHFHGGGWVVMEPAGYTSLVRKMAFAMGAVAIAPNYRKAPEHLFPAAIDDCIRVTKYFLEHAEEFGVDAARVSISGDSAGGNLGLAVSLHLLSEPQLPAIKGLGLIYPALQALDFGLPCYQKYEHGPNLLDKPAMINYWLLYAFGDLKYYDMFNNNSHVSDAVRQSKYKDYVSRKMLPEHLQADGDPKMYSLNKNLGPDATVPDEITAIITNPMYAPLMASDEDLAKMPPTHVLTAEFDVLRDEGYMIAERLKKNNVKVKHVHLPGEGHGCVSLMIDLAPSMVEITKDIADFISQ